MSSAVTLQRVLGSGGDLFLRRHHVPLHVHKALSALADCRTPRMGFHVRRCPAGHVVQLHYNA